MHILVRRDQFNITPDGILHKPTDACFVPNRTNRRTGIFRRGNLGAPRATGDAYDADEVEKVMLHLWAEYIDSTGVQPEHDGKSRPRRGRSGSGIRTSGLRATPKARSGSASCQTRGGNQESEGDDLPGDERSERGRGRSQSRADQKTADDDAVDGERDRPRHHGKAL